MSVSTDTFLQSTVVEMTTEVKPILGSLEGLSIGLDTVFESLGPLHSPILTQLRKGSKPSRASPSVSPALKSGVLDGGII